MMAGSSCERILVFLIILCFNVVRSEPDNNLILPLNENEVCYMDALFINHVFARKNPRNIAILVIKPDVDKYTDDYVIRRLHSVMGSNYSQILQESIMPVQPRDVEKTYSVSGYSNECGIFMTKNLKIAEDMIFTHKFRLLKNPDAEFITILYDECRELSEIYPRAENVFRELWLGTGIIHMILVILCSNENSMCLTSHIRVVLRFDPFCYQSEIKKWGRMFMVDYTKEILDDGKLTNFKGYPFKVTQFQSTHVRNRTNLNSNQTEYWGQDVNFAKIAAKTLNFTPILTNPGRDRFGYRMNNGSFTGMLKDLLEGKSDISLVSSFIKDYETEDLEFTSSISVDRICLIVPKAKSLPGWLILSKCFSREVWLYTFLVFIFTSLVYVGIVKFARTFGMDKEVSNDPWNHLVIRLVSILLSDPVLKVPRLLAERLFMTSCIIWSLTLISGAFQGSLTNAYTTPSFYPDIDTLEGVDKTGFPIRLSATGLIKDIFGDEPVGTVPGNLRSKIKIFEKVNEIGHSNFATVQREFAAVSTMTCLRNDVKRCPLHLVEECPKTYSLAYLLPKKSALLASLNSVIQRLLQGGIMDKWYHDTVHLLQMSAATKQMSETVEMKLNLDHMQLAFYLWFFGMTVSTVMFLFEFRF